MKEQKIKQDSVIFIGRNIREIRKSKNIKQVDMVKKLQLMGIDITRESLVKIERGIQHIYASQLKAIKEVLSTTYDELLKWGDCMIKLNAINLLEKNWKTKYWLYKQMGMSYQNFNKMINNETKSIKYDNL